MKFKTKFKILLHKGYFDTGLSVTSYVKYLIAFFGIASLNAKLTMIIAIIYGISCYILGRVYYKYKWIQASYEVQNRFNLFVKEMRKKIKV